MWEKPYDRYRTAEEMTDVVFCNDPNAFSSVSSLVSGFIYTCGGTLKGRNGTIESPGYPHGYPNGANCTGLPRQSVGRHRDQHVFKTCSIRTSGLLRHNDMSHEGLWFR
ncbi:hypothetical protein AOLI_G00254400 [Acnodon oligacanthus]